MDLNLEIFRDFLSKQPIIRAWIFGSFARGEQTMDSDIDLLVDFDKNQKFGLLKIASIINGLEDLSGRKIDLVDRSSLYPSIKEYVDQDKILIYERVVRTLHGETLYA